MARSVPPVGALYQLIVPPITGLLDVKVVVPTPQNVFPPRIVGAGGKGLTVNVVVPLPLQPNELVAVQVYVVVTLGDATGLNIVEDVNDPDGDHE